MSTKKIIILALAVLIIGAGVIYFLFNKQVAPSAINSADNQLSGEPNSEVKQSSTPAVTPACSELTDKKDKEACEGKVLDTVNSGKKEDCDTLVNGRDQCNMAAVTRQAVIAGSIDGCKAIANATSSQACSAQVLMSLAIKNKDKKYCEQMAFESDKAICRDIVK